MKTMSLDEILNTPLSESDKKIIQKASPCCTDDCIEQTPDMLSDYKPWYMIHPKGDDMYDVKIKKTLISIRIDNDILAALKASGCGYQSRVNEILRKAVLG